MNPVTYLKRRGCRDGGGQAPPGQIAGVLVGQQAGQVSQPGADLAGITVAAGPEPVGVLFRAVEGRAGVDEGVDEAVEQVVAQCPRGGETLSVQQRGGVGIPLDVDGAQQPQSQWGGHHLGQRPARFRACRGSGAQVSEDRLPCRQAVWGHAAF